MRLAYTPAQESDIDVLFALNKALIDRYEDRAAIDYEKVLGWVRRKLQTQIGEYRRVTVGGETAGYYHFHEAGGKMELDDLYILSPWQGRGLGTAVIGKCCAEARTPVFLYVFQANRRAVALYERQGFRITREAGGTRYIMEREPGGPAV